METIERVNSKERNITKVRAHDAIVGVLYISSIILALQYGFEWLYLAMGVAILQIISPFTKMCPVYMILNKIMPDSEPIQNGR